MKKILCVFLMVITFVCGCDMTHVDNDVETTDDSEKLASIYDQGIEAEPPELTEEELSKLSQIVEAYKIKLRDNTYIYLPYYDRFSLIDMDQNGISEIVLDGLEEGVLVLYYYDNDDNDNGWTAYCSFAPGTSVRKDGTLLWNDNAGHDYGSFRLKFSGRVCEYIETTRVVNEGTESEECYINGIVATGEEMKNYAICTERAQWYEFNMDNVVKYINIDNIIDKSLFCSCHKND